MHADFTLVVEHAKSRIAFGRPIGSFQAVKHLLADTSLWLEMSKGMVAAAAAALGDGSPDAYSLAAAAASFTGERGTEVADNCFQVFGGMGFTWEHDQHFYLRRLTAAAVEYGTPEAHRARLWDLAAAGEAEEN
jgi:alkylation response protein AidB-like acyl-CoA dehydrogenase